MHSIVGTASTLDELAVPAGRKWKSVLALIGGVALGLLFLVSGGWKVLQPFTTGQLLEQAKVPAGWGPLGAAALGSLELFAAALLFLPRFRRLGGLLGGALLLFFLAWVAYYYTALTGQECSCFPFIKRAIGPWFFVEDAGMLLMGLAAYFWSPTVKSLRTPVVALVSIAVLSGASFGWGEMQRTGLAAPSPIVVDGKPESVTEGKVFLFFYDPMCMHCNNAAKFMSGFQWGDTRVIAIPTTMPQWAEGFLHDNGFKAGTSLEDAKLRKTFQFVDPPYGVALVNGHQKASFGQMDFEPPAPKAALLKLGFIH
jgi:uncharacterized membrane protein YphA (DoxX/SURF4 family)